MLSTLRARFAQWCGARAETRSRRLLEQRRRETEGRRLALMLSSRWIG